MFNVYDMYCTLQMFFFSFIEERQMSKGNQSKTLNASDKCEMSKSCTENPGNSALIVSVLRFRRIA